MKMNKPDDDNDVGGGEGRRSPALIELLGIESGSVSVDPFESVCKLPEWPTSLGKSLQRIKAFIF